MLLFPKGGNIMKKTLSFVFLIIICVSVCACNQRELGLCTDRWGSENCITFKTEWNDGTSDYRKLAAVQFFDNGTCEYKLQSYSRNQFYEEYTELHFWEFSDDDTVVVTHKDSDSKHDYFKFADDNTLVFTNDFCNGAKFTYIE